MEPWGARARFITEVQADGQTPVRLCTACARALTVARAGILISVPQAGLEVLCASDDIARRVEWTQLTLGEGPGIDVTAGHEPIVVPDLAAAIKRWPTFTPAAVESGIGAMYALPLQLGGINIGVLDLFRDTPAELSEDDFAGAAAVADLVSGFLIAAAPSGQADRLLGQWWNQSSAAREVHQATGMVMAQLSVSAREAYLRLQAFAYAEQRLLDDVAHAVVNHLLRFDPDP